MMELASANLQPSGFGPAPIFAALDTFWILVAIAIGTWIYNWIRNKAGDQLPGSPRDQERAGFPPATPPPPGAPSSAARSWEEEIRRLLGEVSSPPPSPRPPPPQSAPPVIMTRPVPVASPQPVVRKPAAPAPAVRAPQPVLVATDESAARPLARFEQSQTAYQKASQLHETVAAHLRKVDQQTEHHLLKTPVPRRRPASAEAAAAAALVRDPRTVRQAVVASLILGPPKSLSQE